MSPPSSHSTSSGRLRSSKKLRGSSVPSSMAMPTPQSSDSSWLKPSIPSGSASGSMPTPTRVKRQNDPSDYLPPSPSSSNGLQQGSYSAPDASQSKTSPMSSSISVSPLTPPSTSVGKQKKTSKNSTSSCHGTITSKTSSVNVTSNEGGLPDRSGAVFGQADPSETLFSVLPSTLIKTETLSKHILSPVRQSIQHDLLSDTDWSTYPSRIHSLNRNGIPTYCTKPPNI